MIPSIELTASYQSPDGSIVPITTKADNVNSAIMAARKIADERNGQNFEVITYRRTVSTIGVPYANQPVNQPTV